ncbi:MULTISPECIES: hypothetical protein [Cupriavidus]|jgi:nicotinamidase-related amidase
MRTALLVLDLINDIVDAQGKLAGGGTAAHARSQDLLRNVGGVHRARRA